VTVAYPGRVWTVSANSGHEVLVAASRAVVSDLTFIASVGFGSALIGIAEGS